MNILLITGESGSGKSSLANSILAQPQLENINKRAFAFGDTLKRFTAEIHEIPLEDLYNQNKEQNRHFIKNVADVVKRWEPLFFTKRTIWEEFDDYRPMDLYICQDWRFDYELDELKKQFPQAKIRSVRLLKNFKKKGNHNSERTLDTFVMDFIIENTHLTPEVTCNQVMKRLEIWFPGLFN